MIVMKLNPMIATSTHYYIKRQSSKFGGIFRVLEVIHITCTCNMGIHDLPDMYALSLLAHGPQASNINILIPMLQRLHTVSIAWSFHLIPKSFLFEQAMWRLII